MTAWKFSDVYSAAYPAIINSILDVLVFDVPEGTSPVSGENFFASLDLVASGAPMHVLASILGIKSIPIKGVVETTGSVLNVALKSDNDLEILSGLARIPLIGSCIQHAGLRIDTKTAAAATEEDEPEVDAFQIGIDIKIGSHTAALVMPVPMSEGLFFINGVFQQLGIRLGDLDFLVPGANFAEMFPSSLPTAYYNPANTSLDLLSLGLTLMVKTSPSFSFSVITVSTSIGIVDIPLYANALYLNPLAVQVSVSNPFSHPIPTWDLIGNISLYPFGKQTRPPSVAPDFTFEMAAQMPSTEDPTFAVSGTLENPQKLPVAQILRDLMDDGNFDTGISDRLVLEKFDFNTAANCKSGTTDHFSVEIAMSAADTNGLYFGLFGAELGIKDFSITVSYVK